MAARANNIKGYKSGYVPVSYSKKETQKAIASARLRNGMLEWVFPEKDMPHKEENRKEKRDKVEPMFGNKKQFADVLKSIMALAKYIKESEVRIMSAISDYAGKVNTAFDEIGASVDGIVGDIAGLKKKIDDLQNSPGTITPEDQKLLDDIQARAVAVAEKVKALDEATENPVEPPPV